MGCNMYVRVERRVNGEWQHIDGGDGIYDGRRNVVFARLAGVRNYEELTPLAETRGIPDDISASARVAVCDDSTDHNITSWLTLTELEQQDWTTFSQQWEETDFSIDTMTKLRHLANGHPDDLRIIFWFDDTYADLLSM